jgi:hypothetical protein
VAKTIKLTGKQEVEQFMESLAHPLSDAVKALRKIIVDTDKEIGEQVKWNSPAFYYSGEMKPFDPKEYKRDILVMNLSKKEFVLLVFPTGATIGDTSGLLKGNFPDGRKTVKVHSLQEAKDKKTALQNVIKKWLSLVEK